MEVALEIEERVPLLTVVACGAEPAARIGKLVGLAIESGWKTQVAVTPDAGCMIDMDQIRTITGFPVITSRPRAPGQRVSPPPDAVIMAPASFTAINKLALGISDSYAMQLVHEAIGAGIPTVVLPFVNSALAKRRPYQRAVKSLLADNVRVLASDTVVRAHAPGAEGPATKTFPWLAALAALVDIQT